MGVGLSMAGLDVGAAAWQSPSRASGRAKTQRTAGEADSDVGPAGESREGGALSGGGLGELPSLYPLRFPPGKRAGTDAQPRPYEYGEQAAGSSRSGGRVQRGRSPLWWGHGGTPQPLSTALPAREVRGSGVGMGAPRRGVGAPLQIQEPERRRRELASSPRRALW